MLHRPFTDEAGAKHSELNLQLHTTYVEAKQRETEISCPWLPLLGQERLGLFGSQHGLDGGQALGSCTRVTCSKVCQLICAVICVSFRLFAYYMLLHTQVKASHRGPKLFYKNKQGVHQKLLHFILQ